MKKKYLLCLLLTAISLCGFAQQVTVYESFKVEKDVKVKDVETVKNNLEWNLSLLARGAFVLTYERKISEYLGLEVGAGPTMYYDFVYSFRHDGFYSGVDYFESGISYKVGVFLSAAAKIYPKQMDDFEGFYVAPALRYRTYNYEAPIDTWDKGALVYQKYDFSYKTTDIALTLGYQAETWGELFVNAYIGAAWSMNSYDSIVVDPMTANSSVKPMKNSSPIILLGISLGFIF